jgi:hypothetical protein
MSFRSLVPAYVSLSGFLHAIRERELPRWESMLAEVLQPGRACQMAFPANRRDGDLPELIWTEPFLNLFAGLSASIVLAA